MNTREKFYSTLRKQPPAKINGTWLIARYDDVKKCLEDNQNFSSNKIENMLASLPSDVQHHVEYLKWALQQWVLHRDDKDAATIKSNLVRIFYAHSKDVLEQKLSNALKEAEGHVREEDSFDFKFDLVVPFVEGFTKDYLGISTHIPAGQLYRHAENVATMLSEFKVNINKVASYHQSVEFLNDIDCELLHGTDKDPAVKIQQSLILYAMVFNTANLITNALADILGKALHDTASIDEEIYRALKVHAPLQAVVRIAMEDVEVGSKLVRKGDTVALLLASGNMDESMPLTSVSNDFDFNRNTALLLSYGRGMHSCFGQRLSVHLARAFAAHVWDILAKLKPVEVSWSDMFGFKSISKLHITRTQ